MKTRIWLIAAMAVAAFLLVPSHTLARQTAEMKLVALLTDSSVVKLEWGYPLNVGARAFYVYRAPLLNSGRVDSANIQLLDSVGFVFTFRDRPPGGVGYAYRVLGMTTFGGKIWSGWAAVYVPPPPAPFIKLVGSVDQSGHPFLQWSPPAGISIEQYYVYRATYDPRILTFAPVVPQLIDSTHGTTYADPAPETISYGYVYQIRGVAAGKKLESNSVIVVLNEFLTLRAFPAFDGSGIELQWSKPVSAVPSYYVVSRAMMMRPEENLDSLRFYSLDTVATTAYLDKRMPLVAVVFYGLAYRVTAIRSTGLPIGSNTAVVPWRIPPAPFSLNGKASADGSVSLSWNDPPGMVQPLFRIFRAALRSSTTPIDPAMSFSLLATITAHEFRDYPSSAVSTAFAYYVEAGAGGISAKTNLLTVVLPVVNQVDRVEILSQPPRTASLNVPWIYVPRAASSDASARFSWGLGTHPPGMTIDSTTGTLRWTPGARGWFHAMLIVYSTRGGRAYQEFDVAVSGGAGSIKGTVTDSMGNPIPSIVAFYKRDASAAVGYKVSTDMAGTYRIENVDAGTYQAYAVSSKGEFLPQWYYQKDRPEKADPITVEDSTVVSVNFIMLSRLAVISQVTFSGRVSDTASNPVAGAAVVFVRSEYFLNSAKNGATENMTDCIGTVRSIESGTGGESPYTVSATTDRSGSYQARVPKGMYIAYAYAQGFGKIFYNDQPNPLKADLVQADSDRVVDFLLRPIPPTPMGSISGMVRDTSLNIPVPARVMALQAGNSPQKNALFTSTDSSGSYTIAGVPPGEYLVLAVPLGPYAPAFYGTARDPLRWKEAARIAVNGTAVTGIDIAVKPMTPAARGYTGIRGTVRNGLLGINGAIVVASAGDGIAGYALTDASGAYTINGLAPQSYSVSTDCIGFESGSVHTVWPAYDLTGAPSAATADFAVSVTATGADQPGRGMPGSIQLMQNFPNPFNPTTAISYDLGAMSNVTLKVFDLLGREVAVLVNETMPPGSYTVRWDGMHHPSGVYFYRLVAGKFAATRKMLLTK